MASSQALRRTEAKAFFANERTFLHWLNISVTVGSVAAAMLGVSGHVHKHWGSDFTMTAMAARLVALAMMVMAIFMAAYATFKFASRASLLKCAPVDHACRWCLRVHIGAGTQTYVTAWLPCKPRHTLQVHTAYA